MRMTLSSLATPSGESIEEAIHKSNFHEAVVGKPMYEWKFDLVVNAKVAQKKQVVSGHGVRSFESSAKRSFSLMLKLVGSFS